TGTNVDAAKVNGKIGVNDATSTDSMFFTTRPMSAKNHENANENNITSAIANTPLTKPLWKRKPTSMPTPTINNVVNNVRTMSASTRPANTAERAIGSERNRSMMPFEMSSASPNAVPAPEKSDVCTRMPGIKKST